MNRDKIDINLRMPKVFIDPHGAQADLSLGKKGGLKVNSRVQSHSGA
jgi:hypothetical protein